MKSSLFIVPVTQRSYFSVPFVFISLFSWSIRLTKILYLLAINKILISWYYHTWRWSLIEVAKVVISFWPSAEIGRCTRLWQRENKKQNWMLLNKHILVDYIFLVITWKETKKTSSVEIFGVVKTFNV